MASAYLKKKIEERAGLADLATAVLDKCAKDDRDPSVEERQQLENWEQRCAVLDDEIGKLEATVRGNAKFADIAGRIGRLEERDEERDEQERNKPKVETRSAGEQFVESDAFKGYRGFGSMPRIEFGGFLEERAAITLDKLSPLLPAEVVAGPATPPVLTPLLDVISRVLVSRNVVSYVKFGFPPEAGGPIAEGELKPEAELELSDVEVTLGTYAHFVPITRQALEDYAQIRSIIETQLRAGLARKLESVAGATLAAADVPATSSSSLLSGIREAIAVLQAAGRGATAVGVNPADYAALDIEAAATAHSGPTQFGSFWGLTTVPIASVPAGTAYVGNFAEAVTWFDRNTTGVFMTDSHADFFVRNKLLILAEQRATFDVVDPAALVKVTAAAEPEGLRATAKAKA